MASGFNPGVDRMRAAGHVVGVSEYPPGDQGIALSLQTIAQKIRDGRLDRELAGWAAECLMSAGLTQNATVRQKCQAILDAFRAQTMYLPDPVGAEAIQAAGATVCIRPGLCVRARDCDDACVAVGSALMSIGIPVIVIKQNFGKGQQQHVMLEAEDENGDWIAIEPSSSTMAVGTRFPAAEEVEIDPMSLPSSHTGKTGPEIVTLGAPKDVGLVAAQSRTGRWLNGYWIEWRYGRWWAYINGHWIAGTNHAGMGAPPDVSQAPRVENHGGRWWAVGVGDGVDVELTDEQVASFGLGAPTSAQTTQSTTPVAPTLTPAQVGPYAQVATDTYNQVALAIVAGNTYLGEGDYAMAVSAYQAAGSAGATSVGPEIDRTGPAEITKPFTQQAWALNGQLAAIDQPSATQVTAQQAQQYALQINALYVQAIGAGALAKGYGGVEGQKAVGAKAISAGPFLLVAIGMGLAGGALVYLANKNTPKKLPRRTA